MMRLPLPIEHLHGVQEAAPLLTAAHHHQPAPVHHHDVAPPPLHQPQLSTGSRDTSQPITAHLHQAGQTEPLARGDVVELDAGEVGCPAPGHAPAHHQPGPPVQSHLQSHYYSQQSPSLTLAAVMSPWCRRASSWPPPAWRGSTSGPCPGTASVLGHPWIVSSS